MRGLWRWECNGVSFLQIPTTVPSGSLCSSSGTYYFLGGFCSELAAVDNFILGNSFPVTFFGIYGGFFLAYGFTLTPYSGSTNTAVYPKGPEDPGFMASLGMLNPQTPFRMKLMLSAI